MKSLESSSGSWENQTMGFAATQIGQPSTIHQRLYAVLVKIYRLGWPAWLLILFLGLVVVGPQLAPYDSFAFDVPNSLTPPSWSHPFGTDQYGRDLLSRMMTGSRSLVTVSTFATVLTLIIGVIWGLVAAYSGGIRDELLMRAVEIVISIPPLLIAIMIITVLGTEERNLILAIAFVYSPFVARVTRSAAFNITNQEYVDAARIAGESSGYIIFWEVLPNLVGVLLVEAAMRFGFVVLLVASLGFLGLGVQPPTPDWGLIISESRNYMRIAPWLLLFPAIGIAMVVVASHALADRLGGPRDKILGDT